MECFVEAVIIFHLWSSVIWHGFTLRAEFETPSQEQRHKCSCETSSLCYQTSSLLPVFRKWGRGGDSSFAKTTFSSAEKTTCWKVGPLPPGTADVWLPAVDCAGQSTFQPWGTSSSAIWCIRKRLWSNIDREKWFPTDQKHHWFILNPLGDCLGYILIDLLTPPQQMEHVFFPPLSRVAVCGGTHGNEMSGVYMLRELKKRHIEQDGSVSLFTVLSNPRAVESCRRYIDKDLNRCFTSHMLRQVGKKPLRKHLWKDTIHDKSVPAFQRRPDGRHALRAQARARAQCSAGTQREPRGRGPALRHSQHHLQHGPVPDLILRRLDPSPHFKAHTGNHGVFVAFPPGWSHPHPWITPPGDTLSHTLHAHHIVMNQNALGLVCSDLCISSILWWPLGTKSRCGKESFVSRARWRPHLSGRSLSVCQPQKAIRWSLWGSTGSVSVSRPDLNVFREAVF